MQDDRGNTIRIGDTVQVLYIDRGRGAEMWMWAWRRRWIRTHPSEGEVFRPRVAPGGRPRVSADRRKLILDFRLGLT